MRIAATLICLAVFVSATDAEARARRSLRLDSGTVWGQKLECDSQQLAGNVLRWRGFRLTGYAPFDVQNSFCQHAPSISAVSLPGPVTDTDLDQYAGIRSILRPGETISASRWAFLNIPTDPCCSNPGESAFQWIFFQFEDAIIAGLFGPDIVQQDGTKTVLPVDATTTYLQSPDGATLWDGGTFTDEWLCFRTDGTFLGAFPDADLANCRRGPDTDPATQRLLVLADRDSDGRSELAVIDGNGPATIHVYSGAAGTLLDSIPAVGEKYRLVSATPSPDSNGDGGAEVALLVRRVSDGRYFVFATELDSGLRRSIPVPSAYIGIDIASVGDANRDGITDVGILARNTNTGRGVVLTRNLRRGTDCGQPSCPYVTVTMYLARGTEPLRLLAHPAAIPGEPDFYAALSRKQDNGQAIVQIDDASGSRAGKALYFAPGLSPVDFALVPDEDADGKPEPSVLLYRNIAPRVVLQRRQSGTRSGTQFTLASGQFPMALRAVEDTDADGRPELAVLLQKDRDGGGILRVRDVPAQSTPVASWSAEPDLRPLSLEALPDLDGNGTPEVGILSEARDGSGLSLFRVEVAADPIVFPYPPAP